MSKSFYNIAQISDAVVKPIIDGSLVDKASKASSLWTGDAAATVLLLLRRPGCILCRDTAQALSALKPQLDEADVRLVCVVHEHIPREVKAFQQGGFWASEVYFDEGKQFFKALGDGEIRRKGVLGVAGALFTAQFWSRVRAASTRVKEHNTVGDGQTMGGLLILKKGGETTYRFLEEQFGDAAPLATVLEEAKKAAGAK